jgi:hypothetical protein
MSNLQHLPEGQGKFFEEGGLEWERSTLLIPVYLEGKHVEDMKMDAFLKLKRGPAFTNAGGYRQFEFEILVWEVHGHSTTIGGDVTFTLSKVPQPRSVCISTTKESDFPAVIVYNAFYDVYLGRERILENQTGLGVGMDVTEIPPRTHVHFQKAISFGPVATEAGACVAMQSMDEAAFEAEVARIRAIRGE